MEMQSDTVMFAVTCGLLALVLGIALVTLMGEHAATPTRRYRGEREDAPPRAQNVDRGTSARERGREAYLHGQSRLDNPYTYDPERGKWLEGWYEQEEKPK